MTISDLRVWALKGAEQRLAEIAEEARAIFRAFPELRAKGRGFEAVSEESESPTRQEPHALTAPRRRKMSAAARKAVSARMTKYWAERRKKK